MTRIDTHRQGADPALSKDGLSTQVIVRAIGGDQLAWAELVGVYASRLFALANSRLRRPDLAEEVVQSVFATVATKLNTATYAEQGQFEAWLFRIAINRIRDQIRSARRSRITNTLDSVQEPVSTTTDRYEERDEKSSLLRGLRDALQGLSDKDREIIELRHHAQMSFKQIADVLDEPVGTLLARHHRALAKLRDLVAAEQTVQAHASSGSTLISNGSPSKPTLFPSLKGTEHATDSSNDAPSEADTP
jgi:RNA polymerase sigma-70 factor, ECF subfamily